jgi:hypothetical protein
MFFYKAVGLAGAFGHGFIQRPIRHPSVKAMPAARKVALGGFQLVR